MVPATRAAHNIEITAESLQEELARLKVQKQSLERELAAVGAHLDSVQRALSALQSLMATPGAAGSEASSEVPADTAPDAGRRRAAKPAKSRADTAPAGPAAPDEPDGRTGAPRRRDDRQAAGKAAPRADADESAYGKLTEQILDHFARAGDADVRARDVAAALGRDADSGSINAVRSTLDRLVGSSRIRRTGRGLYRANEANGA
ncbi:hypothetical protein [Streptomyces fructofermentans]|uniref:hypothetical protein n=1 Tax=Streptomyces fructofermentans TaxID=152141 RepID=UPI003794B1BC